MDKCKQDDEKICMSEHEYDCQQCSISGRRPFQDMSLEEQEDILNDQALEELEHYINELKSLGKTKTSI